jgi:hypothetical protein
MANHEKTCSPEPLTLAVIEGGRRQREEELLREFLRPGVGNLQRIRRMAGRLKAHGEMTMVESERSGQD